VPESDPKPAAEPAKTLVDEYDLGNTTNNAEPAGVPPSSEPSAEFTQPEAPLSSRPVPPKDPVTGRFVPREPTQQEPAQQRRHAPSIVHDALEFGIPEEEIETTDPGELQRTVLHMRRQAQKLSQENNRIRLMQSGGENAERPLFSAEPGVPVPQQPSAAQMAPAAPAAEADPFDTLIEAGYDKDLLAPIKALRAEVLELRQLKQQVQSLTQREVIRHNLTLADQIDRAFASLPAEFESVLGKQPRHEIEPGSAEGRRRIAVLNEVQSMAKQPGTLEQKISRAAKLLYGTNTPAAPAAPESARNGLPANEEWDRAALARPTQRRGANEPKGRELAERSVAAALRELESDSQANGDLPADSFLE